MAERVDAHLDEMSAALKDADKAARMQKVEELKSSIIENDFTEEERTAWGSDIKAGPQGPREAGHARHDP